MTRSEAKYDDFPSSSKLHIKLNASDRIPSHYSDLQQKALMSNKMWQNELTGNHLKAEYWRRRLQSFKDLSMNRKKNKLKKLQSEETHKLQIQFDSKCRHIVDSYTTDIERLNEESMNLVQKLKDDQSDDMQMLKEALKESYGTVKINKNILDLRKIEYSLGRCQRFLEAQQVKEHIERLQKNKARDHFRVQIHKDKAAKKKLQREHAKEMKSLLHKLAFKKTKLYKNFQSDLLKLDTWMTVHDKRLQNEHRKDLLKLEKRLLAQAPPKTERRISHILDDNDYPNHQSQDGADGNDENGIATNPMFRRRLSMNAALRSFQRSQGLQSPLANGNLQFLEQSLQQLNQENDRLSMVHEQAIDEWDEKKKVALRGVFKQHIEGIKNGNKVSVEIDDLNQVIRWKPYNSNGRFIGRAYDMRIECKMGFDDIIDVQGPSMCPIFDEEQNEEQQFVPGHCFSILSGKIGLHLEASSIEEMYHFTKKLTNRLKEKYAQSQTPSTTVSDSK